MIRLKVDRQKSSRGIGMRKSIPIHFGEQFLGHRVKVIDLSSNYVTNWWMKCPSLVLI